MELCHSPEAIKGRFDTSIPSRAQVPVQPDRRIGGTIGSHEKEIHFRGENDWMATRFEPEIGNH